MPENSKQISSNFCSTGQPSAEALQQIAQAGFRSLLNLRSPDEAGNPSDEAEQAKAAGLDYANVPLSNANPSLEQVDQALAELENLPQPVLIHCAAGARAGAIALIAASIQEDLTPEQIVLRAQENGISLDQPHLHQYIEKLKEDGTSQGGASE